MTQSWREKRAERKLLQAIFSSRSLLARICMCITRPFVSEHFWCCDEGAHWRYVVYRKFHPRKYLKGTCQWSELWRKEIRWQN